MRTDVGLAPGEGSLGYGRITGRGSGRKQGADQRALLDLEMGAGYLRELERAYRAGEIRDYPLVPQGRLVGGVIRLYEGPPRVRPRRTPAVIRAHSLQPLTRDALRKMFHELERLAGVQSRPFRGWYGNRRLSTDMAQHVEQDERVLNAITGHAGSGSRRGYQNKLDPTVMRKSTETRGKIRGLALKAGEAAVPVLTADEQSPPVPPPAPAPDTLGKVENEAPAELGDSAGVADESWRAGDRTRTGDVQLGKLAFYH
jgi:hypothetical protein